MYLRLKIILTQETEHTRVSETLVDTIYTHRNQSTHVYLRLKVILIQETVHTRVSGTSIETIYTQETEYTYLSET